MGKIQKISLVFIFFLAFTSSFVEAKKKKSENVIEVVDLEKSETPFWSDLEMEDFELENFLSRHLPELRLKEARRLAQARKMLQKSQPKQALKALQYFEPTSPLAPYAAYYRSVALKKLGKSQTSLQALPVSHGFQRRFDWDVFWHKLDLYSLLKKTQDLKLSASQALKADPKGRMTNIKAHYFLGKGFLLSGQRDLAMNEFQKVLVEFPGTEYDSRIFQLANQARISQQQLLPEQLLNRRAEIMIESGFAHKAVKIYFQLMQGRPQVYAEKHANALFRARQYLEASKAYAAILAKGSFQQPKLNLLVTLSQALARCDQTEESIAINEKIIRDYSGTSAAANSRAKLGFLHFDAGHYDQALRYFSRPTHGRKIHGSSAWYRFWSFYLKKDYPKALSEARRLHQISGRSASAIQFDYWVARILLEMGKKSEARQQFQLVNNKDSRGYYGLLSRQWLKYGKLNSQSLVDASLVTHVPSVAGDPFSGGAFDKNFTKAALLYYAGLDNEAFEESEAVLKLGKNPNFATLAASGNFHRIFARSGNGESSYPRAYKKYLEPFSAHWKIPVSLAYAVMRQESAFKPEAYSWAFAYGLMQIIPPTGEEISGLIAYKNYHTQLLNQPLVNTLFGTHYLSHLYRVLKAPRYTSIAAYNAGPDAVGRWVKKYKDLPADVFVEMIPYEQTHDYVKKVLVNQLIYERLYGK